jgi:hypothetical protein
MLGQWFFWLLVMTVVLSGVVGIRRAGGVLAAQQIGQSAALMPWDVESGGRGRALTDLAVWWGLEPDKVGRAVYVRHEPSQRSVTVRVRGGLWGLFGGVVNLGTGSFQRVEEFYPGPPSQDGWE